MGNLIIVQHELLPIFGDFGSGVYPVWVNSLRQALKAHRLLATLALKNIESLRLSRSRSSN